MVLIDNAEIVAEFLGIQTSFFPKFINHLRAACIVRDSVPNFLTDDSVLNVVEQLVSELQYKPWFTDPPRLVYLDKQGRAFVFVMRSYAYYLPIDKDKVEELNDSFDEETYKAKLRNKPCSIVRKPF